MKRSLERHLSLTLALAILAAGLVAALASFGFAYYQAQQFQDDTLRQIAELVPDRGPAVESRRSRHDRAIDGSIDDSDAPLIIVRLPAARDAAPPAWLPQQDPAPGFHTLPASAGRMRIFVRDAGPGRHVVVAQATDVRDDSAFDSAWRTLVPLLILLPLLVGLAAYIVRAELAPLRHLARRLDQEPAQHPHPLPDADVPEEVTTFVHAINDLLERIARLMNEQRRFIADAAHELRTPLTALSLQAQNLDQAASLAEMRERLVPLRAGILRARQLTQQLLNLARTQAADDAKTAVDVSRLARELIAECLPAAEARGIDLGLDETAQLHLAASTETLRLILNNALENAIRHTPQGGEVTLRLTEEAGDAVLEVADTGPGIPAAERERVFDAFYRGSGTVGEGSGLGLAIAREAAARLGGRITLDAGPNGSGTVFRYRQAA